MVYGPVINGYIPYLLGTALGVLAFIHFFYLTLQIKLQLPVGDKTQWLHISGSENNDYQHDKFSYHLILKAAESKQLCVLRILVYIYNNINETYHFFSLCVKRFSGEKVSILINFEYIQYMLQAIKHFVEIRRIPRVRVHAISKIPVNVF